MYISVIVHLPAGCTCEESVISFCLRAAGYGLTLCYALGLPVGGAIQVSQLLLLLLITEKKLTGAPCLYTRAECGNSSKGKNWRWKLAERWSKTPSRFGKVIQGVIHSSGYFSLYRYLTRNKHY